MLDSTRFPEQTTMYDLRVLRDNLDAIREQLGARGADVSWDRLRTLIEQRRALTNQVEQLRHELKKGSEEVAKLKRTNQPAEAAMVAMKTVGDRIKKIEDELRGVEEILTDLNLRIPNLPHSSVPAGKDPDNNVEARRWGTPPTLSAPAKSHDTCHCIGSWLSGASVAPPKPSVADQPKVAVVPVLLPAHDSSLDLAPRTTLLPPATAPPLA